MATITVKDAAGATQTVSTLPTNDGTALPVTVGGTVPVSMAAVATGAATAANQTTEIAAVAIIGTRAYAGGQQIAVTSTSGATSGLAATEALLHSSTRCFVRVATAATAAAGIPLEAGEKFHLRLNSGQQIHVIRDTADGFLNVVPVA